MFKINKEKKLRKTVALIGIFGMLFFEAFPLATYASCPAIYQDCIDEAIRQEDIAVANAANRVGSSAETTQNKQQGPGVQVSFSSASAYRDGTTATATAVPSGFAGASDSSKLYFTWYLKRKGCDLEQNVGNNDSCDLDGDNDITVNDWKIAAARIIVKGNFDNSEVNYNSSSSAGGGVKADPSIGNDDWRRTVDHDQTNVDSAPYCYVQDPNSGMIYELTSPDPDFSNACSGAPGTHLSCIHNTTLSCAFPDPGNPPAGVLTASDTQVCSATSDSGIPSEARCVVDNSSDADLRNYIASVSCGDGEYPICLTDNASYILSPSTAAGLSTATAVIFSKGRMGANDDGSGGACDDLFDVVSDGNVPPAYSISNDFIFTPANEACNAVAGALVSETDTSDALIPTCTFRKGDNLCKHLFPYFPENEVTLRDGDTVRGLDDEATGDGDFSITEKHFWGADPTTEKTNGIQNDEAAVMGLGANKISWTYYSGDEIGVAVEGVTSMPTEHNDSSYKIMWAFSKGTCSALEDLGGRSNISDGSGDLNEGSRGFYTENNNGIFAANVDLDDCLEENLINPKDNDQGFSNMKVDLNAVPQNPVNDESGGDMVKVIASAQNVIDLSSLTYDWKIERSMDGANAPTENTNWQNINSRFNNHSAYYGVGNSSLSFLLNLQGITEDVFYLRVKVTASENSGSDQTGKASIIIKVQQKPDVVGVHSATADASGKLDFDDSVSICTNGDQKAACPVTQDEIIGLEANDGLSGVTWKINGRSFSCTSAISDRCSGSGSGVLFFPVLGNEGEAIDVVATGINNNGQKVEEKRHFIIVKPQITITTADDTSVWPKLLGYYKDLNGNKTEDRSYQVLETYPGKIITVDANFLPAWRANLSQYDWYVDGEALDSFHNQRQLSFTVNKEPGENYNIGIVSVYDTANDTEINNLRKALWNNWGISPGDVYIADNDSANIQINVMYDSSQDIASSGERGIMASLITHLPQQTLFLLEIILTSMLLLLSTGLLFAFIPESIFEKKEE